MLRVAECLKSLEGFGSAQGPVHCDSTVQLGIVYAPMTTFVINGSGKTLVPADTTCGNSSPAIMTTCLCPSYNSLQKSRTAELEISTKDSYQEQRTNLGKMLRVKKEKLYLLLRISAGIAYFTHFFKKDCFRSQPVQQGPLSCFNARCWRKIFSSAHGFELHPTSSARICPTRLSWSPALT